MRRICKGDDIIVIAGKDKGRRGVVLRAIGDRLVVDGIGLVKKHQKPNPMRGIQGGIVEKNMSIHISNVAIFNPLTQKADRVGFGQLDDGRKIRVYKSNNENIGG